jgi:glycosyltransferase involved in cell wall biosynthesis
MGGRAVIARRLSNSFALAGHQILLIGSQHEKSTKTQYISDNFSITLFEFPDKKDFEMTTNFMKTRLAFLHAVQEFEPDVIHYHNTNHASIVFLLDILNQLQRKPTLICSLHDAGGIQAIKESPYSKHIIENTDLFVTPSEFMFEEIEKLGLIEPSKLKTIILGVPIASSQPRSMADRDQKKCLIVANLEPHKGIALVLAAWRVLVQRFPEATLHVVGDGPNLAFLKRYVDDLNINNSVTFEGWIEYGQIADLLNGSGLLFAPVTIPEPFGLSVAEAQMWGVPVVASALGALNEIVEDDKTGFLIPSGDIIGIVEAATKILEDKNMQHKMSFNAHKRALEHFNFERTVLEYLKLFKR